MLYEFDIYILAQKRAPVKFGGKRITRARILFVPVDFNSRKLLGSSGVDSASLIVIDLPQIAAQ